MEPALIVEWVIKSVILLLFGTGGFAYLTLYERRALARIQTRIGPNRAGPFGLLQPVADGIKLIFNEELIPDRADKLMFVLAPIITVFPALVIWAVIPWGTSITLFGRVIPLYLADVNIGVLYLTAIASIAVYGIVIAGWASNNKYALLGGLRSSAQMVSYELALGLSMLGPIMLAGSMSLVDIVEAQSKVWYVVWQPLAFIIFMIAALAEVNRAPFDMPEAEQELVAGYHSEYSGMKFALFFMAEYIKMIAVSAIAATMFLGGYKLPFIELPAIFGPAILMAKIIVLLFGMIWVRATLPRFRYDRLMAFGWKVMLPLALLSVFVTAVIMVIIG
jgi:NADH-quinone oxidoreductase subunit H